MDVFSLNPGEQMRKKVHLLQMPEELRKKLNNKQIAEDMEVAARLNRDLNYEYEVVVSSPAQQEERPPSSKESQEGGAALGGSAAEDDETLMSVAADLSPKAANRMGLRARRVGAPPQENIENSPGGSSTRRQRPSLRNAGSIIDLNGDSSSSSRPRPPTSSDPVLEAEFLSGPSSSPRQQQKRLPLKTVLIKNFLECECCFADDVPAEEAVQCVEGGHIFCKNCVATYIENLVNGQFGLDVIKVNASRQRLVCFCATEACDSYLSRKSICSLAAGEVEEGGIKGELASGRHMRLLEAWWQRRSLQKRKPKNPGPQNGEEGSVSFPRPSRSMPSQSSSTHRHSISSSRTWSMQLTLTTYN